MVAKPHAALLQSVGIVPQTIGQAPRHHLNLAMMRERLIDDEEDGFVPKWPERVLGLSVCFLCFAF